MHINKISKLYYAILVPAVNTTDRTILHYKKLQRKYTSEVKWRDETAHD